MRLGIAHHFGWAVAVIASADHQVVDRRRIELIEPGVPAAPIHHEGGPHLLHRSAEPLDDNALAALVADVRASVVRATSAALDELASALPEPIVSMSLRAWPADFPEDIAVQRRVPYESRADSVMYCQVLAELARERGWAVHLYNAKTVEDEQPASWVSERTRCFTARGQRWDHRGRRTIGWRSRQRSWSPDPPWEEGSDPRVRQYATFRFPLAGQQPAVPGAWVPQVLGPWHPGLVQSVYEAAGGDEGVLTLAHAWHARVLADEVVSHAFSHGVPSGAHRTAGCVLDRGAGWPREVFRTHRGRNLCREDAQREWSSRGDGSSGDRVLRFGARRRRFGS